MWYGCASKYFETYSIYIPGLWKKKTDPFIYLIVRNIDLFIYCPLIFIPIYCWYQEDKQPWQTSKRKNIQFTGMSEKWGLSNTNQEKIGSVIYFLLKKKGGGGGGGGVNHIPGSAEKMRIAGKISLWQLEIRRNFWLPISYFLFCHSCSVRKRYFLGMIDKPPPDLTYHISTIRFVFYYQPNYYLTNSSLLTLTTLNSAFKHIILTHSEA